jgi:leader peptidase (prepilin peptidase) / N-methyltransferase
VPAFLVAPLLGLITVIMLETLMERRWQPLWAARGYITDLSTRAAILPRTAAPIAMGLAASFYYDSIAVILAAAAATWLSALAITTDLVQMRIPREPCWAVLGLGVVAVLVNGDVWGITSAAITFVVLAAAMLTTALISRGGLGSGDIRLVLALTPLAAWVGAGTFLWALLIAAAVQIPGRVLLRRWGIGEGKAVPFAPALVAGVLLASVAGAILEATGSPVGSMILT